MKTTVFTLCFTISATAVASGSAARIPNRHLAYIYEQVRAEGIRLPRDLDAGFFATGDFDDWLRSQRDAPSGLHKSSWVYHVAKGEAAVLPSRLPHFALQLARDINTLRVMPMTELEGDLAIDVAAAQQLIDYHTAIDVLVMSGAMAKFMHLDYQLRMYQRGKISLAQIAESLGITESENDSKLALLENYVRSSTSLDTYEVGDLLGIDRALAQLLVAVDEFNHDHARELQLKELRLASQVEGSDGAGVSERIGAYDSSMGDRVVETQRISRVFQDIAAEQMAAELEPRVLAEKYERLLRSKESLFIYNLAYYNHLLQLEGLQQAASALEIDHTALPHGQADGEDRLIDLTTALYLASVANDSRAATVALEKGADLQKVLAMWVHSHDPRRIEFLLNLDPTTKQDKLNALLLWLVFSEWTYSQKTSIAFLIELGAAPIPILIEVVLSRDSEALPASNNRKEIVKSLLRFVDFDAADAALRAHGGVEDLVFLREAYNEYTSSMLTRLGLPRLDREQPTDTVDHDTEVNNDTADPAPERVAIALQQAVYQERTIDIANILHTEDLSADVVIDAQSGATLLYHAAAEGKLTVVKFLIEELDADPNVTDKLRLTVLDAAQLFGHDQVAAYLREHGAISAPNHTDAGIVAAAPTLDD